MNITKEDLEGIETFEIPYTLDGGYLEIKAENVTITINKRPFYCDRGRYNLYVHNIKGKIDVVDGEDFFPRYFFKLENLFSELYEWIIFNGKNIGEIIKPVESPNTTGNYLTQQDNIIERFKIR